MFDDIIENDCGSCDEDGGHKDSCDCIEKEDGNCGSCDGKTVDTHGSLVGEDLGEDEKIKLFFQPVVFEKVLQDFYYYKWIS